MQQIHISEKALAIRWGISHSTLQRWRSDGGSLPYYKIGKVIRYPLKNIEHYEKHGICKPTANDKWGLEWEK